MCFVTQPDSLDDYHILIRPVKSPDLNSLEFSFIFFKLNSVLFFPSVDCIAELRGEKYFGKYHRLTNNKTKEKLITFFAAALNDP